MTATPLPSDVQTYPNAWSVRHKVKKIKTETGIDFRSLRHSNATLLLDRGANTKTVQLRMGLKSVATYIHATARMEAVTCCNR